MIALTWEEEKEQLTQLFGQYKRLRGGRARARDPYERMTNDIYADEVGYIRRLLEVHVHTCIDRLCEPSYCYSCCQTKCEQHWKSRSGRRRGRECNECITLFQSLHGYHINGCRGCTKNRCWMCERDLCVKAFPLTFRKRIIEHICSDCLGEGGRENFNQWVAEQKR